MARQNTRGLELSFHKSSKRWRKMVNGKYIYLRYGAGVSDLQSYQAALAKYRQWQGEQESAAVAESRGPEAIAAYKKAIALKPDYA